MEPFFSILIGGVLLIIAGVWVLFSLFVKALLIYVAALIIATVLTYVVTLVIRAGKVVGRLWRLYKAKQNAKHRTTVKDLEEEECDMDDCPPEVQEALRQGKEVAVKRNN